jgi:hypothetical protein
MEKQTLPLIFEAQALYFWIKASTFCHASADASAYSAARLSKKLWGAPS